MAHIDQSKLFGKLNAPCFKAFESAMVFCKLRQNPSIELIHWVHQVLQLQDSDLHHILNHFEVNHAAPEFGLP